MSDINVVYPADSLGEYRSGLASAAETSRQSRMTNNLQVQGDAYAEVVPGHFMRVVVRGDNPSRWAFGVEMTSKINARVYSGRILTRNNKYLVDNDDDDGYVDHELTGNTAGWLYLEFVKAEPESHSIEHIAAASGFPIDDNLRQRDALVEYDFFDGVFFITKIEHRGNISERMPMVKP